MIHQSNNLFFGRLDNGSVRILKLNRHPDSWPKLGYCFPEDTVLDVVISAEQWSAIVNTLGDPANAGELYNATDFNKQKL